MAILALVGLGGAVAAAYVTSVELGAGLAPIDDPSGPADDVEAAPGAPGTTQGPAATGAPTTTRADTRPGSTPELPDRARPPSSGTGDDPSASEPDGPSTTPDEVPGPAGPFPGVWPYGTWAEVDAHRARGDGRFLTPTDTALRLARDVAGSAAPTVTAIDLDGHRATVTVENHGATTRIQMVRAVADGSLLGVPWSVTGATGGIEVTAEDRVAGATFPVRTSVAGVVGVFDRSRWRGVGVTATAGPLEVRVEPGDAGTGMLVGLEGDPRDPASFSLRPVEIAPGAGAPAPLPNGVQGATDAFLAALGSGDVRAAWAVLAPTAQQEALDWRGLAARTDGLHGRWAGLADDGRRTVTVATGTGEVAVVLPASGSVAALTLALDGGTARVASIETATTEVVIEADAVVVQGRSRPSALLLDGTPIASEPVGPTGARLSLASVPPGPHIVTAVAVEDGRARAARHALTVAAAEPDPTVAPPVAG